MSDHLRLSQVLDEDVAALRTSGAFDEEWYVNEYPDVRKTGIDAARHYLWLGRRLGRKPSGRDVGSLPAAIPEQAGPTIAATFVGQVVGSTAEVSPTAPAEAADMRLIDRARRLLSPRRSAAGDGVYNLVAEFFDEDYYLTTYPDVAAAQVDPVQHYLDAGWQEQRDPSLSFSTRYYLENNPDVAAAGVNPFYHYHAAGKAEGRPGKHQLGFRWDILARLTSVADQIRDLKSHRPPPSVSPASLLDAALKDGLAGGRKLIVSFSHDDFTRHVGGVQLLLRRELRLFRDRGDAHVHVFPEHALPFLDTSGESVSLGVLVNGRLAGFFQSREIASALVKARPAARDSSFVVHSLLGHNMDETVDLLETCGIRHGVVWLHDYSPIYNNFKLLRNDVEYCGFPRESTLAYELCEYARADFSHATEFAKLFDRFQVKLLSPSQLALDIWNEAGVLRSESSHVVEHVKLIAEPAAKTGESVRNVPLRIGFLGYPALHKGWAVFQDLVMRYGDDPRYEFHHLGKSRIGGLNAHFHDVSASETRPDAMREAVEEAELDIALLWSIWPETFCLTAYEALAAGAFLITNPNSGNVVSLIAQSSGGVVLSDEKALHAAFVAGDLAAFARSRRLVSRYRMDYSNLSLEILD